MFLKYHKLKHSAKHAERARWRFSRWREKKICFVCPSSAFPVVVEDLVGRRPRNTSGSCFEFLFALPFFRSADSLLSAARGAAIDGLTHSPKKDMHSESRPNPSSADPPCSRQKPLEGGFRLRAFVHHAVSRYPFGLFVPAFVSGLFAFAAREFLGIVVYKGAGGCTFSPSGFPLDSHHPPPLLPPSLPPFLPSSPPPLLPSSPPFSSAFASASASPHLIPSLSLVLVCLLLDGDHMPSPSTSGMFAAPTLILSRH